MKLYQALSIALIFFAVGVLVGWTAGASDIAQKAPESILSDDRGFADNSLPSQAEIQEILVNRGYKLKIDGVIGIESRRAWDRAICDENAAKRFE